MSVLPESFVRELETGNLPYKEHLARLREISDHVESIFTEMMKIMGRKLDWYAFQNDEENTGDGTSGGSFNPDMDMEFIHLIGDYDRYDGWNGFPTRFLWTENWQSELPREKLVKPPQEPCGGAIITIKDPRKKGVLVAANLYGVWTVTGMDKVFTWGKLLEFLTPKYYSSIRHVGRA